MEPYRSYSSTRDTIISESPEIRGILEKTALKRRIGVMFASMRAIAGLSQRNITEETTWDKGFVSRLEGAHGGIPEIETIVRFAKTCGLKVGLVVCKQEEYGDATVVDALDLYSVAEYIDSGLDVSQRQDLFRNLVGNTIRPVFDQSA
jgi:transcriptional regulator with XRE-family HTH domain